MKRNSKLGWKIKSQITKFTNFLSAGFHKPKQKFLLNMIYGIQANEDVKISNIVRSLNEDIGLIQTEKRLTRQLSGDDLTEELNKKIVSMGKHNIEARTILALDLSDISKPYSEQQEFLADVWDGSRGRIGKGYWLCSVTGADIKGEKVTPLYTELFSHRAVGFESENAQIFKAVDCVVEGVDKNGVWVIDRGGDREILINGLLDRRLQFIIRAVGNRKSENGLLLDDIAMATRCMHQREVVIQKSDGKKEKLTLRMGLKKISFPSIKVEMTLVVVHGFGEKPMMLLTNAKYKRAEEFVNFVLEAYLTRWKCEESFRFIKQSYQLEDVRLRSYVGLRNIVVLVHAVFYFVSVLLGQKLKLNILLKHICEKAQRFFEMPAFKNYAIADGIYKVLFNYSWGIERAEIPENHPQLSLPLEMAF